MGTKRKIAVVFIILFIIIISSMILPFNFVEAKYIDDLKLAYYYCATHADQVLAGHGNPIQDLIDMGLISEDESPLFARKNCTEIVSAYKGFVDAFGDK